LRKTKLVTIDAENRDKGKTYLITEMGAAKAEKWAMRALLALMKSGIEVPEDAAQQGIAGLANVNLSSLGSIPFELAEPLLDEMMECVKIAPAAMPQGRALMEEDIEEISTRLKLRKEVLDLHIGFFYTGNQSESAAIPAKKISRSIKIQPQE
jgi:hypothetical protein